MNVQTATPSTFSQDSVPAEARVVLRGVNWQTFKALMAYIAEDRYRFSPKVCHLSSLEIPPQLTQICL